MSSTIGNVNGLIPGLQPGQTSLNQIKPDIKSDGNFTEIFNNLMNSVNDLQLDAGKQQELLAAGESGDLHQVMIAAEKAGIAMDLLLEIRNKLVDAYQTMMRMPM